MKKTIFISASVLLLLGGCDGGEKPSPYGEGRFSKTYIDGYSFLGNIECEQPETDNYLYFHSDIVINATCLRAIYKNGTEWVNGQNNDQPQPNETAKHKFDSLSNRFGDHFNAPKSVIRYAFADEFLPPDVTSDRDFNEQHPAGTSLADLIYVYSASFYKYIQSGYQDPTLIDMRGMLCDFTEDDFKMKAYGSTIAFLKFTVTPPEGEHNFTITLRTTDDRVFTATCTAVFE